MSDQDLVALTWLETHPPDGLALPLMHAHAATNTAYRDLGILNPRMRCLLYTSDAADE